jgi:hypothetical protein
MVMWPPKKKPAICGLVEVVDVARQWRRVRLRRLMVWHLPALRV